MARKVLSAGGVVFRREDGALRLLLIKDRFGRWTLPKGHVEAGERPEEAALREIREETGITGRVVAPLPSTTYSFRDRGVLVEKTVRHYLIEATGGELVPQQKEVADARWFAPGEIEALPQYENNRQVLRAALERLGG